MLANDIKILRTVEDARYTDDQVRVPTIRVEFMVGRQGPFVERIDKEMFTRELRDDKINRFADHVRV